MPKDQAAKKARKTEKGSDQVHDADHNETDDAKKAAKKFMKTKQGNYPEND